MPELTQQRLRSLLRYKPSTGQFIRLVAVGPKRPIGSIVKTKHRGRATLFVDGVRYIGARLAVLYMTGSWPIGIVDHKDGNPANDRWSNLRDTTYSVNAQNQRRAKANSKTGLLGVSPHPSGFRAIITRNGVRFDLGLHRTAKEAHAAYLACKRRLHEGCTV